MSPADGHVLNAGRLHEGKLIQCKGHDFAIQDLLVDPKWLHVLKMALGVQYI